MPAIGQDTPSSSLGDKDGRRDAAASSRHASTRAMQCSSSSEYDYDGRFGGSRLSPHLTGAAAADEGRVLPRVSSSEEEDKENMSDTASLSSSESESWGSDINSDASPFDSGRVFMCYLYLYGKARLSLRQYDAIREV